MMYRRNIARSPRADRSAATTGVAFAEMAVQSVKDFLDMISLYERAQRENRQRNRAIKRHNKCTSFPYCGQRQQERYGRQVARGQLKAENGLVA